MTVEIRELPELHVAYVRRIGPYGPDIGNAFHTLMNWAERKKLFGPDTQVLAAYWDNPDTTPPEECRSDACITLSRGTVQTEEGIHFQTLKSGTFAVYRCEVCNNDYETPWNFIVNEWLPTSGHHFGPNPCYEIYHNDASQDPDGKWILDICLSVEPD